MVSILVDGYSKLEEMAVPRRPIGTGRGGRNRGLRFVLASMTVALAACACSSGTAPSVSPPAQQAGWQTVWSDRSHVTFAVPSGWHQIALSTMRQQIAGMITLMSDAQARDALVWALTLIDDGRVDITSQGPAGSGRNTIATVTLVVDTGDSNLDSAVLRIQAEEAAHSQSRLVIGAETVSLPVGAASMVRATSAPPGTAAAMNIEYIVRTRDGRTLWLSGTSLQTDVSFPAVMAAVAASLFEQ